MLLLMTSTRLHVLAGPNLRIAHERPLSRAQLTAAHHMTGTSGWNTAIRYLQPRRRPCIEDRAGHVCGRKPTCSPCFHLEVHEQSPSIFSASTFDIKHDWSALRISHNAARQSPSSRQRMTFIISKDPLARRYPIKGSGRLCIWEW